MSEPIDWPVVEKLLPSGWQEKARELGAFERATYIKAPGTVLRLLLLHASNSGGMRDTVAQAAVGELADVSDVALLKRLRKSRAWMGWIASALAAERRARPVPGWNLRPRAVDSTMVQGPSSTQPDWRVHYSLDMFSLDCDWHELTDAKGAEGFERVPVSPGDVLIGDRNFLTHRGAQAVRAGGAHLLVRLRWSHPKMLGVGPESAPVNALDLARTLEDNKVGSWRVLLTDPVSKTQVPGRIVALRLPPELARTAAERRVRKQAKKNKAKRPDARSIESCKYVLLFTTVPEDLLSAEKVLELYRHRWQIELAFKRHKQLLRLGHLPHTTKETAQAWIAAKLVLALLLEKLHRNAMSFSPWGYSLEASA